MFVIFGLISIVLDCDCINTLYFSFFQMDFGYLVNETTLHLGINV